MNKLDKDIELAKKQIYSIILMAGNKNIEPTTFIKENGFMIPIKKESTYSDKINFTMKPNYEIYGKNTLYYFTPWKSKKIAVLLGTYSDEDFRNTKYKVLKNGYHQNNNKVFVFITWGPSFGFEIRNTTQIDSWSGWDYDRLYGYSFKTLKNTFMNWNNPPI